jgi:hypothetical protein
MRARNLKPGFFRNEDLADLPFEYRLLFQGLWCLADREGRLENRPKRIKGDVFPHDQVDVVSGLIALAEHRFIQLYEVNGTKYIQVLAFNKHQNPHCKEAASMVPAPCKHSASTENSGARPADSLNPDSLNPDSGERGDARPVPEWAAPVLDAYHRVLPKCQQAHVLNDKRKKRIAAAIKLAKQVCACQGWPYGDGVGFWDSYFTECATDAWMRGEVPNPKNASWKQNLDVLLAEDRFAGIMDRAIATMRGDA